MIDMVNAISSATIIEAHIPSVPQISGIIITARIWKTRVLRNEIIAEVSPSFKAVKNDEPNIAIPAKRNEKQKNIKPLRVRS